jgi:hypothetical protein
MIKIESSGVQKGVEGLFQGSMYDKAEATANYIMFVVYICLPTFFGSDRGM